MFGFFFGALAAVAVMRVLRYRYGGGFGLGRGGWGTRGGGGFGPRWFLRGLYERLNASPGQERVIGAAVDEVADALSRLREERHRSRADVANAVKAERFDPAPLNEMFARHDAALAELRKVVSANLSKVHEALEARQRTALAEILQYGPGFGGGCGFRHRFGSNRHGGYRNVQTV